MNIVAIVWCLVGFLVGVPTGICLTIFIVVALAKVVKTPTKPQKGG